MFLDDEMKLWWCLGATWRCTPSEAIGLWSVILFYMTVLVLTIIHSVILSNHETIATGSPTKRRRSMSTAATDDDDWRNLISLMVYFFTFCAGCLVWVAVGPRWVHPVQIWQLQLLGSAILLGACIPLFVAVHLNMGENWSPIPEQKEGHQLVTHGVFQWARHPMYAVFLWAALATLLATLNWVIAWCVFGSVVIAVRRIETEERMLVELFGQHYLEYRQQVSALGPPWGCLGFDGEIMPVTFQQYEVIH